jgi:hypothetical protein
VRWFGETWGASCCKQESHVATPLGRPCAECTQLIELHDQGVMMPAINAQGAHVGDTIYHRICFFKHLGLPVTIHLLFHGMPLCGFTTKLPKDWPNGHVWDPSRPRATCENCKREYDARHAH